MYKTLDVRGLAHHQRPPAIFGELSRLGDSEQLELLVEIEPLPMYKMLEQKGYECTGKQEENGSWKVTIVKKKKEDY